jgi:hypothetical protein
VASSNFDLDSSKLEEALKALGAKALPTAAGSLYRSAEKVMNISKSQYVPVDTGALMGTGHVEPPNTDDAEVVVQLGYGGPAAPYAIFVHEMNKHYHNGRQWKYLETPLNAALSDIEQALVDDFNEALGKP